jgi:hypothetical protein
MISGKPKRSFKRRAEGFVSVKRTIKENGTPVVVSRILRMFDRIISIKYQKAHCL